MLYVQASLSSPYPQSQVSRLVFLSVHISSLAAKLIISKIGVLYGVHIFKITGHKLEQRIALDAAFRVAIGTHVSSINPSDSAQNLFLKKVSQPHQV